VYVNVSFATHPDGIPQTIIVMVCRVGVFFGSTKQKCASNMPNRCGVNRTIG
jgi:hypothetical protein